MYVLDQMHGVQGVGLARAGRPAALVHTAHRAALAQDDRTAGDGFVILGVPHADARHVADGVGVMDRHGK